MASCWRRFPQQVRWVFSPCALSLLGVWLEHERLYTFSKGFSCDITIMSKAKCYWRELPAVFFFQLLGKKIKSHIRDWSLFQISSQVRFSNSFIASWTNHPILQNQRQGATNGMACAFKIYQPLSKCWLLLYAYPLVLSIWHTPLAYLLSRRVCHICHMCDVRHVCHVSSVA